MSYDRETRKKRRTSKVKKKRNPVAKGESRQRSCDEMHESRRFAEVKHEMETKHNRKMRDSEILALYLMEEHEDDDDLF